MRLRIAFLVAKNFPETQQLRWEFCMPESWQHAPAHPITSRFMALTSNRAVMTPAMTHPGTRLRVLGRRFEFMNVSHEIHEKLERGFLPLNPFVSFQFTRRVRVCLVGRTLL